MQVLLGALRGIGIGLLVVGVPAFYLGTYHSADIAAWLRGIGL